MEIYKRHIEFMRKKYESGNYNIALFESRITLNEWKEMSYDKKRHKELFQKLAYALDIESDPEFFALQLTDG